MEPIASNGSDMISGRAPLRSAYHYPTREFNNLHYDRESYHFSMD